MFLRLDPHISPWGVAMHFYRAVARLGSLSPHYLDDVGIGDGFGIEGAEVVPKPPAMRT